MKTAIRAMSLILLVFVSASSHAQDNKQKLGYVNITKVLESLPAYQDVQKKMKGYVDELQKELGSMQAEHDKKVSAYQQDGETLTAPIKEIREQEIVDLEQRMQKLQASSNDQISQKQVELLKPLEDTVMSAIKAVATDKGVTYVFDVSTGSMVLYYPEGDDITEFVKTKLGVK